jgi:outer membrane protein TolC
VSAPATATVLALVLALSSPAHAHPEPSAGPITLAEAVSRALSQNPDVVAAQMRLEEARARIGEARGTFFPQLRLSSSGGLSNNFTSLLGSGGTGTETVDPASLLGTTNYFASTRLSLSQTVWDWGRAGTTATIADLDEQVAAEQLRQARQDASLQARTAYFNLVAARATTALRARAAAQANASLAAAESRARRGIETDLIVLQARTRALSLEADARKAARDERKAESSLALAVGSGPHVSLAVTPFEGQGPETPGLEEARQAALANRPDLRIADAQVRQEAQRLESEAKSQFPQLVLSASGGLASALSSAGKTFTSPDFSVLGAVSWPLFDGFRAQNAQRRGELAVKRTAGSRERLVDKAKAEVESERDALLDSADRRRLAEEQQQVAARSLKVVQSRAQQGLATQLDVLDAQIAVLEAEHRANQALYDRTIAQARLSKAMGEDPPAAGIEDQ